eukprot:TRINITY_DN3879_c0_g1_i7.p1 TRINITY_DN3879_c0_g1~~TRINITY_DN3879_c0_g1_i7.p1  ORF type:complete len:101 (+),score=1.94 TRINITY_DN3879_c0_g1_i7:168-470(+)
MMKLRMSLSSSDQQQPGAQQTFLFYVHSYLNYEPALVSAFLIASSQAIVTMIVPRLFLHKICRFINFFTPNVPKLPFSLLYDSQGAVSIGRVSLSVVRIQ